MAGPPIAFEDLNAQALDMQLTALLSDEALRTAIVALLRAVKMRQRPSAPTPSFNADAEARPGAGPNAGADAQPDVLADPRSDAESAGAAAPQDAHEEEPWPEEPWPDEP
jgi:hypothetical protein